MTEFTLSVESDSVLAHAENGTWFKVKRSEDRWRTSTNNRSRFATFAESALAQAILAANPTPAAKVSTKEEPT